MTVVPRSRPSNQAVDPPPTGRPPAFRWMLGVGAGVLGGEGVTGYLHPVLGEALAMADVTITAAIAFVLLTAILRGSNQTCERVFRLLRWIANRAEPPAPQRVERVRTSRQHRDWTEPDDVP